MKVLILSLFFFSFTIAPAQHRTRGDGPDFLEAEFTRIANAWKDAYNSMDTIRIASLYTDDALYVSPHAPGLVANGREEIVANFVRGMKAGGHIDTVEILKSEVSCNLAYLVCRYDATNNGQKVSGRNVIVLRNVNGAWRFVTHASIIRD